MRVVDSTLDYLVGRPVKGALTVGTKHLVAPVILLNVDFTLWALFELLVAQSKHFHGFNGVVVANVLFLDQNSQAVLALRNFTDIALQAGLAHNQVPYSFFSIASKGSGGGGRLSSSIH